MQQYQQRRRRRVRVRRRRQEADGHGQGAADAAGAEHLEHDLEQKKYCQFGKKIFFCQTHVCFDLDDLPMVRGQEGRREAALELNGKLEKTYNLILVVINCGKAICSANRRSRLEGPVCG